MASFLFRLRDMDTPNGVSDSTMKALMEVMGLGKTDLVHYALKMLADNHLPHYEEDDGPLTDDQILKIRQLSTATGIAEDTYENSLI